MLVSNEPKVRHEVLLNKKPIKWFPGKNYSFLASGPIKVSEVDYVTLQWFNQKSISRKLLRAHKITVNKVTLDPLYVGGNGRGASVKSWCGKDEKTGKRQVDIESSKVGVFRDIC